LDFDIAAAAEQVTFEISPAQRVALYICFNVVCNVCDRFIPSAPAHSLSHDGSVILVFTARLSSSFFTILA